MVLKRCVVVVVLLLVATSSFAQTTRSQRISATERVVIGTSSFGSTSPLQIVGLPAKSSETDCVWVDSSGNLKKGACVSGITSLTFTMPGIFNVSGSPCTGPSCTIAVTLADAPANSVFQRAGTIGTPSFSTSLSLGGTLGVTGATTLSSTLGVTGATTLSSTLGVTGATTLSGGGAVRGTFTPASGSGLEFVGNAAPAITAYNRTGSVYLPLVTNALTHDWYVSGLSKMTLDASANVTLVGDLAVNGGDITSTANPLNIDAGGRLNTVDPMTFASTAGTLNYASQTTGWRIDAAGGADFRYLFVDEMHAKVFIADLEQALAGGQIISKSVALVHQAFTCPTTGSAATGASGLYVRDLPSAAGMAVFQNNDWVVMRTFSRSAGSLTIAECVGTVTLDTTYGVSGFTAGTASTPATQRYNFTRGGAGCTGAAGSFGASTSAIAAETLSLDFGVSGNGYYEVNSIDGAYAANSPYAQVVTWSTCPVSTNRSLRTRFGQLNGSYNYSTSTWGFAAGDATTANITIDSTNGIRIRSGTTNKITLDTAGNANFTGTVTVTSGSSGYANLTDKPTLGTLAAKSSVDLATGEVTNKSLANVDSAASTKLAGIATGATVGATWGGSLTGTPVSLTDGRVATALNSSGTVLTMAAPTVSVGTPGTQGLYLGADKMGFYQTGAPAGWKTYMDNTGKFYLTGTGTNALAWDGTTLSITGVINVSGSSNVNTKTEDATALSAKADGAATTTALAGKIATGGARADTGWANGTDTTKIDGGSVYVSSSLGIGSTTWGASGIQMQGSGTPRVHIGNLNGGGNYIRYESGVLTINGNVTFTNTIPADTVASNAAAAASAAQGTANTAVSNASTAQGTANTAVTNASTAQGTANGAASAASTAQGTANTANGTANTALTNAATADGKAVTANNAAATADGKAVTAQNAAATADGKAVTAQNAAVAAQNTANARATTDLANVAAQTVRSATGWQGADATKINGGLIYTGTIIADALYATALNGKTITGSLFQTGAVNGTADGSIYINNSGIRLGNSGGTYNSAASIGLNGQGFIYGMSSGSKWDGQGGDMTIQNNAATGNINIAAPGGVHIYRLYPSYTSGSTGDIGIFRSAAITGLQLDGTDGLEVRGIYMTNWITAWGTAYTLKTCSLSGTTSYICHDGSSLRYKNNVVDSAQPVERLLDARLVDFTMKQDTTSTLRTGLIAEELDALGLKTLVIYDKQGRPDAVEYDRLGAWMIPLLRQQRDEIAQLKARLTVLEAR